MKSNNKFKLLHTHFDWILIAICILAYTVVFSYFSILRHNAFASGYDLANMDQTIWNSLQGRFFSFSQYGATMTRFTTHADIILVLLAPLYLIWNNVRMLLIFQSFVLALGAIPTYLIGKLILRSKPLAFLVVGIYLLNPGMQWTNIYDFHAVSMAIPLLLLVFYFGYTGKWRWYLIAALFAALTKEQVPLTIGSIGIALALLKRGKAVFIGPVTLLIGIVYSLSVILVVIPYFEVDGMYKYAPWYDGVIQRIKESKLIDVPGELIRNYVMSPDALAYYRLLLTPFGLLPLFGLPIFLIIAGPELSIILLSYHAQMRSIMLHYDSVLVPGLVISSIYGIHWTRLLIYRLIAHEKIRSVLFGFFLFSASALILRFSYFHTPTPVSPTCWCRMYDVSEDDKAFAKLLETIPRDASVTASPEIRPHITHRRLAYTMPDATASADFIAIIDQNRLPGDYNPKGFELELMAVLDTSEQHELVKRIGHFSLYQRTR